MAVLPKLLLNVHMLVQFTFGCSVYMFYANQLTADRAMVDDTYKVIPNTDQQECFLLCKEDCKCESFQVGENRCELNNENSYSKPDHLITKYGYRFYDLLSSNEKGGSCKIKNCCDNNPCQQNAPCEELCNNQGYRVSCKCSSGYVGKYCQTKVARSCSDHKSSGSLSGVYQLFDMNNQLYSAYCDFTSEPAWSWTLISSLSRTNIRHHSYRNKPFFENHPVNEDDLTWELYRLSHSRMIGLRDNSTHWRVTCNFSTTAVDYIDYVRSSLEDYDLIAANNVNKLCINMEYIDVRGINCSNCTVYVWDTSGYSFHVDLKITKEKSCSFPRASLVGEDVFGGFWYYNEQHRCASTASSTSNYWLGKKNI